MCEHARWAALVSAQLGRGMSVVYPCCALTASSPELFVAGAWQSSLPSLSCHCGLYTKIRRPNSSWLAGDLLEGVHFQP